MKPPVFSVVVPTFHRNDLLAVCLRLLDPANQTLENGHYEVIVTDDGTTNSAEELIRREFPWVRWVEGPRKGPAANRNNGAAHALGDWTIFTDDDCEPRADWLKAFADSVRPETSVYEGKTVCEDWIDSPEYEAPINESGGMLWSCNMMVARTLFTSLGGFDQSFPHAAMEDIDFRERVKSLPTPILFVPSAVVNHPRRPRRSGATRGRLKESTYYYRAKHGLRLSLWKDFVRPSLLKELKRIRRGRNLKGAWSALRETKVEIVYVIRNFPAWRAKYPGHRPS